MVTPERRAEIEALLAAATPGPWEAHFLPHGDPWVSVEGHKLWGKIADIPAVPQELISGLVPVARESTDYADYGRGNALLIAAAPTIIAELLTALDEATKNVLHVGPVMPRPPLQLEEDDDR